MYYFLEIEIWKEETNQSIFIIITFCSHPEEYRRMGNNVWYPIKRNRFCCFFLEKGTHTLQASTQNGMKQQIQKTKKNIIRQRSQANRPEFFSIRVIICCPHCGHLQFTGYSPKSTGIAVVVCIGTACGSKEFLSPERENTQNRVNDETVLP